jgi:hypothetical protein
MFDMQVFDLAGKRLREFPSLIFCTGLAFDRDGNLLTGNNRFKCVSIFRPDGHLLTSFRGNNAGFDCVLSIGVGHDGRIYVIDNGNYVIDNGKNAVQVFAFVS